MAVVTKSHDSDGPETDAQPARRTGGRSARVRSAVIAATVEEMRLAGYQGLSVAAVAARAGVAETSIYRRWKTREGLMAEARFALFSESIQIPDRGSLRADLIAFLSATGRFLQTPLGKAAITSGIATPSTPSYDREIHALWNRRFRDLHQIFDRAVARSEWPTSVDPQPAIEALIGAIYLRSLVTRQRVTRSAIRALVNTILPAEE